MPRRSTQQAGTGLPSAYMHRRVASTANEAYQLPSWGTSAFPGDQAASKSSLLGSMRPATPESASLPSPASIVDMDTLYDKMSGINLGWTHGRSPSTTPSGSRLEAVAAEQGGVPTSLEKERERERRAAMNKADLIRGLHSDALFNWRPANARFFVIKSFTEEDVWKSLKYKIWSSTEMGNRRLAQAFKEASSRVPPVPLVLFFSVNASGHFCGVSQMISNVDWGKSSSVWTQDKWKGTFGVRWIFVKDVPNAMLRHLKVVNNDNKPVTNSRDTQEIMFDIGCEMLKIFADHRSKTSIIDDWDWYDQREAEQIAKREIGPTDSRVLPSPSPSESSASGKTSANASQTFVIVEKASNNDLNKQIDNVDMKDPLTTNIRETDYDNEVIPRAIYNNPIDELLLRAEGASGRRRRVTDDSLQQLKKSNSYILSKSGNPTPRNMSRSSSPGPQKTLKESQSKEALPEQPDGRVVVLTELGVDIISATYVAPLPPLPKANIQSPTDRPVYNPSAHKALPPTFHRTERYGSWKNAIASAPLDVVEKAHETCQAMEDQAKEILEEHCLRYERTVDWSKRPKIKRSGLSFRGRGVLELRAILMDDVTGINIKPPPKQQPSEPSNRRRSSIQSTDGKIVGPRGLAGIRRPSASYTPTDSVEIQFRSPLLASISNSKTGTPKTAAAQSAHASQESSLKTTPLSSNNEIHKPAETKEEDEDEAAVDQPIEVLEADAEVAPATVAQESYQAPEEPKEQAPPASDVYVPPTALRAYLYETGEEKPAQTSSSESLSSPTKSQEDEDQAWLEEERKALFSFWGRDTSVEEPKPSVKSAPAVASKESVVPLAEMSKEIATSKEALELVDDKKMAWGIVEEQKLEPVVIAVEKKLPEVTLALVQNETQEEEEDAVILAMKKMRAAAQFDNFDKESVMSVPWSKPSTQSQAEKTHAEIPEAEALEASVNPAPERMASTVSLRSNQERQESSFGLPDFNENESLPAPLSKAKSSSASLKRSSIGSSISKSVSKLFTGKESKSPKKSPSASSLPSDRSPSSDKLSSPAAKSSHDSLNRSTKFVEEAIVEAQDELQENHEPLEQAHHEIKSKRSSTRSLRDVLNAAKAPFKSKESLSSSKSGRSMGSLHENKVAEFGKSSSPSRASMYDKKSPSTFSIPIESHESTPAADAKDTPTSHVELSPVKPQSVISLNPWESDAVHAEKNPELSTPSSTVHQDILVPQLPVEVPQVLQHVEEDIVPVAIPIKKNETHSQEHQASSTEQQNSTVPKSETEQVVSKSLASLGSTNVQQVPSEPASQNLVQGDEGAMFKKSHASFGSANILQASVHEKTVVEHAIPSKKSQSLSGSKNGLAEPAHKQPEPASIAVKSQSLTGSTNQLTTVESAQAATEPVSLIKKSQASLGSKNGIDRAPEEVIGESVPLSKKAASPLGSKNGLNAAPEQIVRDPVPLVKKSQASLDSKNEVSAALEKTIAVSEEPTPLSKKQPSPLGSKNALGSVQALLELPPKESAANLAEQPSAKLQSTHQLATQDTQVAPVASVPKPANDVKPVETPASSPAPQLPEPVPASNEVKIAPVPVEQPKQQTVDATPPVPAPQPKMDPIQKEAPPEPKPVENSKPKGRVAAFVNAMDMMNMQKKSNPSPELSPTKSFSPFKKDNSQAQLQNIQEAPRLSVPAAPPSEPPKQVAQPANAILTPPVEAPKTTAPTPMIMQTPAEKERARLQAAAVSAPPPTEPDAKMPPPPKKLNSVSSMVNMFSKKKTESEMKTEKVAAPVSSVPEVAVDASPEAMATKVVLKGVKCDVTVENFEFNCLEKGKPAKGYFPIELRRVIHVEVEGDEVNVHACITREKGMEGAKLKKIKIQFELGAAKAKAWAEGMKRLVYGADSVEASLKRSVLVLVDKFDGKEATKMVEKHMIPVWETVGKPADIKSVQFNEFSVSNALAALDWSKIGNVVVIHPEFAPRLCQVLVRGGHTSNPVDLPVEADPVDAALSVLKSSVSKSKAGALHITGFVPKREEGKIAGFFKAFK
ncbi:hypothetical protein HDV05_004909 [Chytridiales sp. JEL 0842]|nr:hypothetical protein HDV05_004909 [Chytridiales sp. JEL 0842]